MSAAVAVQTPPATVAVVVTVVLPSVKCTVTVWPSSTPGHHEGVVLGRIDDVVAGQRRVDRNGRGDVVERDGLARLSRRARLQVA